MPYSTTTTASSGRKMPIVRRVASMTMAMAMTPNIRSMGVCCPGRWMKMPSKKTSRYSEKPAASAAKIQSRQGMWRWLPSYTLNGSASAAMAASTAMNTPLAAAGTGSFNAPSRLHPSAM